MKKLAIALMLMTSNVFAQEVVLADFNNWKLTDIAASGYKKEVLFKKMNRDLVKVSGSICSNRALMWVHDFKRFQNIDAGKMFMFYTRKTGEVGRTTWWYHVTPVVNENGTIYTMDAGFPYEISGPLLVPDWLKSFTGSTSCKEIRATDTDLIKRMFSNQVYPETTSHGTYDCYYMYAPAGYWTPASVAKGLLGVDATGRPVHHVRDEINKEELFSACVEAVTSSFGRAFGGGKRRCREYLGL